MNPYTNKTVRINDAVCLYSEINAACKARKKAARFEAKMSIKNEAHA